MAMYRPTTSGVKSCNLVCTLTLPFTCFSFARRLKYTTSSPNITDVHTSMATAIRTTFYKVKTT